MPQSTKELRRRIKSITATKQITRAMEMVSASKLRRSQEVLLAGRPYAGRLQELLSFLASSTSVESHPLFEAHEGNRDVMVVFTSDRGLCGGFNSNMMKLVERHLADHPDKDWSLYCIGKRGAEYFGKRDRRIIKRHVDLGGKPDSDLATSISHELLELFESGQADAIHLAYPSFITLASNKPIIVKFLNLDPAELRPTEDGEGGSDKELDYILEPSAEQVFDSLLPRYLSSKIYITMAELFTSEHSARMLAMHNATKNCDEMADALTLQMNKARQTQITNELIEIVSGAQAV